MRRRVVAAFLAMGSIVATSGRAARAEDPEAAFETRVRPVLAGTCFPCHGGRKTSGGLRVDSREALIKGGNSGPAVVPGEPAVSRLVQAVRHSDADLKMPPGGKLPDDVTA